ncbi:MAG: capsular exopolysaccharide family [Anaerocolumna sp.]|jgi:capsular polysaccharide biosynthesis protein|nr:capsular exopolysaccharide family [Anaerocolumna sp.]
MDQTTNNDEIQIDLKEIFYVLLHKLWIIIIVAIIGAAALGFVNLYFITPLYTSTTKIYVINRQDETKTTASDLASGTQLTQDYMILVTSYPVLEHVLKNTQVDMTPDELSALISLKNPDGTRILEINVTDTDPERAKLLADAIAEASADQLVKIMEIEKVNIVEYGRVPSSPTGQNIKRSFIVGGVIGAVLAAAIIIAVHMLNDNIRTTDDIEHYLGITTLGMLPLEEELIKKKHKSKIKKNKKNVVIAN